LDSLVFIYFFNQFWIAVSVKQTARSLLVASIAVSLAKVVAVGSGVVGRSAVYGRYNNGSTVQTYSIRKCMEIVILHMLHAKK
jgi:hypothetical protein